MLAHSISLINIQSGVALQLLDEQPEQARTALAAINDASAEALREVRSVLGVLRGTGERRRGRPTAGLGGCWTPVVAQRPLPVSRSRCGSSGEPRPLPPAWSWRRSGSCRSR